MLSKQIYDNLCDKGKYRRDQYTRYSNLHKHHIIPVHMGGSDEECNFTYLSIKEHIIAHYLLYRIYKNPNDLRSMYMLGAELSPLQRKVVGEFCRDNRLGFHGASSEQKREWSKRGFQNGKDVKYSYYWWTCTREGVNERHKQNPYTAWKTNDAWLGQMCSFKHNSNALKANKLQPKKPVTNGITTKKFYTEHERDEHLNQNPKWRKGCHWSTPGNPGNTNNRKKVTDGSKVFNALIHAAEHYSVSSATIINWIRSPKKPDWSYVSDTES